jgi:hypothetical protein
LAVAVPLTRAQFLADLAQPEVKDYATHVKRANLLAGAADEYYCDLFERSATVARRVCAEVEVLGVTVSRATRPQELTELLTTFKAVTLVTHWRFMRLLPEDIIDVRGLLHALTTAEERVPQAVGRAVAAHDPGLLAAAAGNAAHLDELRARLASALNAIVAASHALYRPTGNDLPSAQRGDSANALDRLTRVELEQAFPDLIAFGRSVEFSDRMYGVPEVVEAVPRGFNGMLDLTTCNSVILGKAIKARHPDCLVAMNRYATALHVRMPLYQLVIEHLAQRPTTFADALTKFHTN